MTDITEHNAQVVVNGEAAANGAVGVAVVIDRLSVLEGAVAVANTANAVSLKTSISGATLTITPSGDAGAGTYKIVAWGY